MLSFEFVPNPKICSIECLNGLGTFGTATSAAICLFTDNNNDEEQFDEEDDGVDDFEEFNNSEKRNGGEIELKNVGSVFDFFGNFFHNHC